mmetsp:Transcript_25257/g.62190  ORF Transcript_25257/g.62190 Transcript_25257/m.62190 type:complete len:91 (-) Transcript_25257:256-528(-)
MAHSEKPPAMDITVENTLVGEIRILTEDMPACHKKAITSKMAIWIPVKLAIAMPVAVVPIITTTTMPGSNLIARILVITFLAARITLVDF